MIPTNQQEEGTNTALGSNVAIRQNAVEVPSYVVTCTKREAHVPPCR